jgi:hypothetical protein
VLERAVKESAAATVYPQRAAFVCNTLFAKVAQNVDVKRAREHIV